MNTSIIIRVKNERQFLLELMQILQQQTNQDFEIIVVDDNSSDGSGNIALDFFPPRRVRLIRLPPNAFSYPYASNLGAKTARGTFLVYLSAHSLPLTHTWLADGLKNFNDNPLVAGIFAYPEAHPYTTIWEKGYYLLAKILYNSSTKKVYTQPKLGILGTTNAIIRKDLWKAHHFDETLKLGSEDYEWACYWLHQGYTIIQDPKFCVYHSHFLSLPQLISQHRKWVKVSARLQRSKK